MQNKRNNFKHISALELDKVLVYAAELAGCADSKEEILNISPINDIVKLEILFKNLDEAHVLIARFGSPSVYGFKNLREILKRVGIGGVLSMEELLHVKATLKVISELEDYYKTAEISENSGLDSLFWQLRPQKDLCLRIERAILSIDEMADEASPTLNDIRRKIRHNSLRIRQVLEEMIASPEMAKKLQDPIVTIRDNRFVLPIKSEHRGEIKGVLHDVSSSGSTSFIEPLKVAEMNNEIMVLKAKEKEEIHRILSQFSKEIGEIAEELALSIRAIIDIDVYFTKARFAYEINAVIPILNTAGVIDLMAARHPLIDKKTVVPIDISLGADFSTLVVTGPNTGGKTVSLKTIGLLSVMAMSGLMIPAKEGSKIAVFDDVFANIGEEQSIEQSLSTFSAHMSHIVTIVKEASDKSLVLLDELGSGTDPLEGAALAIAILEDLKAKGAIVAATTHYAELKIYALETEGVQNASCEFDISTLSPTYKLLIGSPGRSNAFAISKKLGLSDTILQRAEESLSHEKKTFERVVSQLEDERKELGRLTAEAELAKLEAENLRMTAKIAMEKEKNKHSKETQKAQAEAKRILDNLKEETNILLNQMREIRREKSKSATAGEVLAREQSLMREYDKISSSGQISGFKADEEVYILPRPLEIGDDVFLDNVKQNGRVLDLDLGGGQVLVQFGAMKTKIDINSLRLAEKKKSTKKGGFKKPEKTVKPVSDGKIMREIDVRGHNIEEAIMEIDKFIDDASFSGVSHVSIIHGKGTGVLRAGVRDFLSSHGQVESFRLGTFGEGEMGVTIAKLK